MAVIAKNEAVDDRARIYEMSELLKAKYATIMDDKVSQSESLAVLEEEKMILVKALMENKLQTTRFQEEWIKDKSQLESSVLVGN